MLTFYLTLWYLTVQVRLWVADEVRASKIRSGGTIRLGRSVFKPWLLVEAKWYTDDFNPMQRLFVFAVIVKGWHFRLTNADVRKAVPVRSKGAGINGFKVVHVWTLNGREIDLRLLAKKLLRQEVGNGS